MLMGKDNWTMGHQVEETCEIWRWYPQGRSPSPAGCPAPSTWTPRNSSSCEECLPCIQTLQISDLDKIKWSYWVSLTFSKSHGHLFCFSLILGHNEIEKNTHTLFGFTRKLYRTDCHRSANLTSPNMVWRWWEPEPRARWYRTSSFISWMCGFSRRTPSRSLLNTENRNLTWPIWIGALFWKQSISITFFCPYDWVLLSFLPS